MKGLLPMILLGAGDADAQAHLDSCARCRAALDALRAPRGTFGALASQLASQPTDCDDESATMIAYGETAPTPHLSQCARCRDRVEQLRAVIARLDRLSLRAMPPFAPPVAAGDCDDEAVTMALYGGTHHDCARCRDLADQLRPLIARLDALKSIRSRATFAALSARLRRRSLVWRVAIAAALLLVGFSPLLRLFTLPRSNAPTLARFPAPDPLAWIDTTDPSHVALAQLPELEAVASTDDPRSILAIRLLRSLGPAGEASLIAALKKHPPAAPAICAALGELRSRAAVPELIRLGTPSALRALIEIRDPQAIPTFLAALEDPSTASIAMDGLSKLPEADVVRWLELFKNGATPVEAGVLASSSQPFIRDTARWIAWRSVEHRQAIIAWAVRDDAGLPFLIEASLDLSLGSDAIDALAKLPATRVARAVERALPSPAASHVAGQLRLPVGALLARFPYDLDACRALAVVDPLRLLDAAIAGSAAAAEALVIVPGSDLRRIAPSRRSAGAVTVLAGLRSAELYDYFVSMLPGAAEPSIRALALLGNRRAVPQLIPYLSDPRVESVALGALRQITGAKLTRRADWERWWAVHRKTT